MLHFTCSGSSLLAIQTYTYRTPMYPFSSILSPLCHVTIHLRTYCTMYPAWVAQYLGMMWCDMPHLFSHFACLNTYVYILQGSSVSSQAGVRSSCLVVVRQHGRPKCNIHLPKNIVLRYVIRLQLVLISQCISRKNMQWSSVSYLPPWVSPLVSCVFPLP